MKTKPMAIRIEKSIDGDEDGEEEEKDEDKKVKKIKKEQDDDESDPKVKDEKGTVTMKT